MAYNIMQPSATTAGKAFYDRLHAQDEATLQETLQGTSKQLYEQFGEQYLQVIKAYGQEFADWYFSAKNHFKGTQWENQLPSIFDAKYSPTLWEEIGQAMGDFSGMQGFYNQNAANIREGIQALYEAERKYTNESPAAQAARMAEAGINTSLPGNSGSISPGTGAVEPDVTPNGVPGAEKTGADIASVLSTAVGTIASVIDMLSSGVSISQAIENFGHTKSMNAMDELKALTGSVPGLNEFLANLTPSSDWTDPATGQLIKAGTPLQASQIDSFIGSLGLRPESSKLLKGMIGKVKYDKNGNPTTGYQAAYNKLLAGSIGDAEKIVHGMSTPGYSDNLHEWAQNYQGIVAEANERILKAQLDAAEKLAKFQANTQNSETGAAQAAAQIAEDQFNAEYYNKLDPEAASGASNEEADARKREAILRGYKADVEASVLGCYAKNIRYIKDSNMSDELKQQLLSGAYAQYNSYISSILREREEELAKGRGVMAEKDWFDFGAKIGGELLDLIPIKSIGKMISKATRTTKNK